MYYDFKNFIVGDFNRTAYNVAIDVSKQYGDLYNPLYISGNSGLGKTHLMYAIEERIRGSNSKINILYTNAEKMFENYKKGNLLKSNYTDLDILIIDNIQFIFGKNEIQREILCLFNILYKNKKQIIIASDKKIKYPFEELEEQLISKFEKILFVNISAPDYESRIKILKNKVINDDINIDDNILSLIAEKVTDNIRHLEGVLNVINAYQTLEKNKITYEKVCEILTEYT